MSHHTPASPLPLSHLGRVEQRVLDADQLRAHGVTAAAARARCTPGGGWKQLLPGVFLLHPGPPSGAERLRAALLYAARHRPGQGADGARVPEQPGGAEVREPAADDAHPQRDGTAAHPHGTAAVVTGLAALALHGLAAAPALDALEHVDILVPHTRRLRPVGFVRPVRCARLPEPGTVAGVPVAPLPRAVADAVAGTDEQELVRAVLAEAVHRAPAAVVAELRAAKLLVRPAVAGTLTALLAADRAAAEGLLYATVRAYGLAEPLWNVDLRLPGGVRLGAVDAYWPEASVAVELGPHPVDPAAPGTAAPGAAGVRWAESARRHAYLERLGVTVVRVPPWALCTAPEQQAVVVRTALMAAAGHAPPGLVRALPR